MDFSAAVRELHSFNQHRTGSNESYKQAILILLSSKNLICEWTRSEESEDTLKNSQMFGEFLTNLISMLNYISTFYIINSYCFNHFKIIYYYTERFRAVEKSVLRTRVNKGLLFWDQVSEGGKSAAAEWMRIFKKRITPTPSSTRYIRSYEIGIQWL
jgi:hypothetical protein